MSTDNVNFRRSSENFYSFRNKDMFTLKEKTTATNKMNKEQVEIKFVQIWCGYNIQVTKFPPSP